MPLRFPEDLAAMSNYSVYFLLQNNGLTSNCSVYSLTLGSLIYQDLDSGVWLSNSTSFLPAYYVTNCSLDDLTEQINNLNYSATDVLRWVSDFSRNPYNVSDNGDSFVALLFMILGLCVLCWMLMLMFWLLSKYKRKPVLTQIATLLYLVVLTIILARITEEARKQYYADSLDMTKVLGLVKERSSYGPALIVSQLLTWLAYLELVVKMSHLRWKRTNAIVGLILIVAYVVIYAVAQAEVVDYFVYLSTAGVLLPSLRAASKLLMLIWFGVALVYHTVWGTASTPRQVSYSRRLAPLAFITWAMVWIHFVISLLMVTLWRYNWLVSSWMTFLPFLLEMYVLTCTWEWYYSIRDLELRLELVGMLGRRISLDDVMSFSNQTLTKKETFRGRFAYVRDLFFGRKSSKDIDFDAKDMPSSTTYSLTAAPTPTASGTGQVADVEMGRDLEFDLGEGFPLIDLNGEDPLERDEQRQNTENRGQNARTNVNEHEDNHNNHKNNNNDSNDNSDEDDDYSYEVEYVDDDAVWNGTASGVQEGSSTGLAGQSRDELPPFRPHPGFSADDYWDEK